jgi:hypothetical protein
MYGLTRGVFTLAGAATAGFLIWLATQIGDESNGGYWAVYGIIAAAGLTMALSQLFGGWTKWGLPRVSGKVFLIGFVPTLIAAGWVLVAHQPDANWFRTHVVNWSGDIGISGLVNDLSEYVSVLGFGLGLVFGFTFDTSGPRRPAVVEGRRKVVPAPAPVEDRAAADEPLMAERTRVTTTADADDAIRRRDEALVGSGGTPVAPQPEPEPPPRAGEPK